MALTDRKLSELLGQCGVACLPLGEHLMLRAECGGEKVNVVAMSNDGKILQLRTMGMTSVSRGRYPLVRRILLETNESYKLIKFTLDPDDGEVVAWIDMALGGADVTVRQLKRCLHLIDDAGGTTRKRVQAVERTGEDPGPPSRSAASAEALGALLSMMEEARRAKGDDGEAAAPRPSSGSKPKGAAPKKAGFGGFLDDELDDSRSPN